MSSPEAELEQSRAALGVGADADAGQLKKAYFNKSYALLRSGGSEDEKARLKAAHDVLIAWLGAAEQRAQAARLAEGRAVAEQANTAALVRTLETEEAALAPELSPYDPRSFDSWRVNVFLPPLVAGVAILCLHSPFGFLLTGFYVWVHEFGHATVAWMTGHKATPLPIGWANISPDRSHFVYFGVLFLLTVLFVAGAKERKPLPMFAALLLALAQYAMTWRWPEEIGYKWSVFGGVGGEFYLSAAMIALYFFRLPEKFKWGACRYFFLFVGAFTFYKSFIFWRRVRRGEEGIPYGSMINGEEDAGGDMNILHDDYGWSQREIIHAYNDLATVCLWSVLVVYVMFALRFDRWFRRT